jgi:hypothetical protein
MKDAVKMVQSQGCRKMPSAFPPLPLNDSIKSQHKENQERSP